MDDSIDAPSFQSNTGMAVLPQSGNGCSCQDPANIQDSSAVASVPSFVYAIGKVECRFPNISVEKEFAQATGRAETVGLTDRQALYEILSQRENRYLARQSCWVLSIEGLETYILLPRESGDYELLVEALRPTPHLTDTNIVIGFRGPIAPAEMCNGLMVPIIVIDQLYSFDIDSLLDSIPRPEEIPEEQFRPAAEELLMRIMQVADNAGATDEHRALNYLVVRYPAIYAKAAEEYARDFALTGIEVIPSTLSNTSKIVEVIFAYTNRNTDFTEKFFVRVDVTGEWPFLVTKLSPYFNR
ncbi:hypothetical protein IQ255_14130 [Pleurocapsales cyanobacterium LEGE 10410]|nr:hypothetical protein [Pleurocapsales cyanobacterium LEGE 10410]